MNKSSDIDILKEIEKYRAELHAIVDAQMDSLIGRLNGETTGGNPPAEYEVTLYSNPSMLKGTKPAAVIFGDERVRVIKWREVYTEILRRCDREKHSDLLYLRNRVAGRARMVISDKPDGMNVPVMLSEDLFVEAYFDTEQLLRTLVTRILDVVRFDYSGIKIAVKTS